MKAFYAFYIGEYFLSWSLTRNDNILFSEYSLCLENSD